MILVLSFMSWEGGGCMDRLFFDEEGKLCIDGSYSSLHRLVGNFNLVSLLPRLIFMYIFAIIHNCRLLTN